MLLLFAVLISFINLAQRELITWSTSVDENKGRLYISAEIEAGWYIYDVNLDENIGPIPTEISIDKVDGIAIEKISEPLAKEKYDSNYQNTIGYYSENVEFEVVYKKSSIEPIEISGDVLYMMCNNEGCLPPNVYEFKVLIKE